MSNPPNPPTGGFNPWAPRPGQQPPTGAPGAPGAGGPAWAPAPGPSAPRPGGAPTGSWGQAPGPQGAQPQWGSTPGPTPGPGGWSPAPRHTAPWAPTQWGAQPASPAGPPVAQPGAGSPPIPPGYGAGPPTAPGGPGGPAAQPVGASPDERGGRLLAAMVGGIVGAVVAALVASGLVLATSDDAGSTSTSPSTTAPGGSGGGAGSCDSADIQHILEIAQPSVVSINTQFDDQPGAVGAGSGFVYDAEQGLILTNAHVIEGASEISVTFFDGSAMGAELVGAFVDDDVAMLRVENVDDMVAAQLGSSDALLVGEDVVAIGNALGLGGKPTVTTGIVSAKDRSISGEGVTLTNLIQTDAAINPGNSGGPLLNCRGEVVGINTAKIPDASNIGFALAIDSLRPLIEELESGNGEITDDQAFLGVSTVALADGQLPQAVLDQYGITDLDGLIVTQVTAGSAAADAEIREGDVVLEADGQITDSNDVLGEVIRSHEPGDEMTLSIERQGEAMDVVVTLKRRGG